MNKQSRRRRRSIGLFVFSTAFTAAAALWMRRCSVGGRRSGGPRSDHYDGGRFHNRLPVRHGALDVFKWIAHRDQGPWRDWVDVEPGPPPPERVTDRRLRVTVINHATVLLQIDGINILTDPIWSERCSPVSWAGPKRHRPPGIRFEDLPPIDLVLLSHNHYDHLDLPTLRRLVSAHRPRILCGLGNREWLEKQGINPVEEKDWWESWSDSPTRVTSVPVQHFSGRGLCDRNATLWCGWVIESPSGTIFFAGDTGWGPHFEEIRQRFGPPRLALLPIGAFRPRWFMSPVHIAPEEAMRAHRVLQAGTSVPMHYGTFHLGDDGETEAVDLLADQIEREAEERFVIPELGHGMEVA